MKNSIKEKKITLMNSLKLEPKESIGKLDQLEN